MDKRAFRPGIGGFDKFVEFVGDSALRIEDDLFVAVGPIVGQVADSDGFPMVGDLSSSAVDHMGHLVGYDEFKVLRILFSGVPVRQIHRL